MKGLALGFLLCTVYVMGMVGLFQTDYAQETDFLPGDARIEMNADTPDSSHLHLVNLGAATGAAAAHLHDELQGQKPEAILPEPHGTAISSASYSIQPGHSKGLALDCNRASEVSIRIYDLSGTPVFHKTGFLEKGHHFLQFNFSHIPQGVYFLLVDDGNTTSLKKIVTTA